MAKSVDAATIRSERERAKATFNSVNPRGGENEREAKKFDGGPRNVFRSLVFQAKERAKSTKLSQLRPSVRPVERVNVSVLLRAVCLSLGLQTKSKKDKREIFPPREIRASEKSVAKLFFPERFQFVYYYALEQIETASGEKNTQVVWPRKVSRCNELGTKINFRLY